MTDCSICCETFNKSSRCPIECKTCEDKNMKACQTCCKKYILDSINDPKCMVCSVEWDQEFLSDNFTKSFISKELKEHKENVLFEKQIARLSENQQDAQNFLLVEQLKKQKTIINDKISELQTLIRKLNSDVRNIDISIHDIINTNTNTKRENNFMYKCPLEDCNGFLNKQYVCGICDNKICKHCFEKITNDNEDEHECDEDKKKTVEMLKKDTKPCPKCAEMIHKTEGCFAPFTQILLWDSSIKFAKDIQVGDILIGDDGQKRFVEELVSGTDDMFLINQNDGIDYIVNSKHKLTLSYGGNKNIKYQNSIKKWIIRWFDINTFSAKSKKFNTENDAIDFKNNLKVPDLFDITVDDFNNIKNSTKKLFKGIKSINGIDYHFQDIQLDPYILGTWLGDGYSNGKEFCTNDPEILEYWNSWASDNNCKITNTSNKLRYYVSHNDNTKFNPIFPNPLKKKLSNYNLINNKHIPQEYIQNTKQIRLQLLAGIIDTDGYVTNNGRRIVITQANSELSKQIQFLAQSLGFSVHINKKQRINEIIFNQKPKNYKDIYFINISGSLIGDIPTKIPRKKCINQTSGVNLLTTNIVVSKLSKQQFYGWRVSGNNNRFLISDFTIAHNCDQMYCIKCHTAFSWRTGEIETRHIHNPEYFRYLRENGEFIPRNPGDIPHNGCNELPNYRALIGLCRTFYPTTYETRTHKHIDNKNTIIISNMYRMKTHILHIQRIRNNELQLFENNLKQLRVLYILNRIDKNTFKRKIQMIYKKYDKDQKVLNVWNLIDIVLNEYLGKIAEISPQNIPRIQGINIIEDIILQSNKTIDFCNKAFKKIGISYNVVYGGITNDWIEIPNYQTYLKIKANNKQ